MFSQAVSNSRFIKLENILRVHQNVYNQRILDKSERLRKQAAI